MGIIRQGQGIVSLLAIERPYLVGQVGPATSWGGAAGGSCWSACGAVGVAVYQGLHPTRPVNSRPVMPTQVIAGLLGSFALSAGFLGFKSARDKFLGETWTAGVAGMLTGLGTLAAMIVIW